MDQITQFGDFICSFFVEGKGLRYRWNRNQACCLKSKKLKQWRIDNAKIMSLILGSVDANIEIPMRGFKTAKEMWNYLDRVYQHSNLARKFQIVNDMFCYNQGEKKIQEQYAGSMALWNEYEAANFGAINSDCCIKSLEKLYDE